MAPMGLPLTRHVAEAPAGARLADASTCLAQPDPVVVIHASDVHTSRKSLASVRRFERLVVDLAPTIDPDALVISGDLVDNKLSPIDSSTRGRISAEWEAYAAALEKGMTALPRTSVLDMTGNHDRFAGGRAGNPPPPGSGFDSFAAEAVALRLGAARGGAGALRGSNEAQHQKPSPLLRRLRRHRSLDLLSRDGRSAMRVVALDASVDPAPTRHFYGRLSPDDVAAAGELMAEPFARGSSQPARPDVLVSVAHYPMCTISHDGQLPGDRHGAATRHPLADLLWRHGAAASLSGHLHQLPQGEIFQHGAMGRPLHARLPAPAGIQQSGGAAPSGGCAGRPCALELEIPDMRTHGAFRVLVGEANGAFGFAEHQVRAATDPSGGAEFPAVVLTSPADARYLRGSPDEAASGIGSALNRGLLLSGVVFAPSGARQAKWRVVPGGVSEGRPPPSASAWHMAELAPLRRAEAGDASAAPPTARRLCGAIPPSVLAAAAAASAPRAPTVWELASQSTWKAPAQLFADEEAFPGANVTDMLPFTAAPGFAVLEVAVLAADGSAAVTRRPISFDGQSPPLPWQRLALGDLRSIMDMAGARALLVFLGLALLPPLFLRTASLWPQKGEVHEGSSAVAVFLWGPTDSLWRHFTLVAAALLAWCLWLPLGPWLVGELLPGRTVALFAWGHVFVAQPGDCDSPAGLAEACWDSGTGLTIAWVRNLEAGVTLVVAILFCAAPLLALFAMAANSADGGSTVHSARMGVLSPLGRVSHCLWSATIGGVGRVSRPASLSGLLLNVFILMGTGFLAVAIGTHHGPGALLMAWGLVWPPVLLWVLAIWLVVLDGSVLLSNLLGMQAARLAPKSHRE